MRAGSPTRPAARLYPDQVGLAVTSVDIVELVHGRIDLRRHCGLPWRCTIECVDCALTAAFKS
jgi:hypothetical protein